MRTITLANDFHHTEVRVRVPEAWAARKSGQAGALPTRFTPHPASVATLARGCDRHRALVALHAQLAGG